MHYLGPAKKNGALWLAKGGERLAFYDLWFIMRPCFTDTDTDDFSY
jgi:hypothetical protein